MQEKTEQRVQELTAQKDRIEKLIADILNEEGYSKLKQIIRENVKAILAENRKIISVFFAVIIQTLRADPEMVKLICSIPTAKDGKQNKDNDNNNVIKYLALKKNMILDLSEKNYENLVEALTNNVNTTTANSSSNPTLSLPQSSSTFPNLSTQSDIYRKEESESIHNNKDDIVE